MLGEGSGSAVTYDVPKGADAEGMRSATSCLSEVKYVTGEEEIPLQIQIFTTQDSIFSYDVSSFSQPEMYAQHGHEQVYALTATFSLNELS